MLRNENLKILKFEDLEMHRPLRCAQRSKARFDSWHGLYTSETLALAEEFSEMYFSKLFVS